MQTEDAPAFALGGLAGNNAHGAGFLQAALDLHVEPSMISCTSGQIFWVYQYLRARDGDQADLRAVLQAEIDRIAVTHNINVDAALLALRGREGVFRPAYQEFAQDMIHNAFEAWTRFIRANGNTFLLQELLQTIPGRVLVPLFSDEFFATISTALNAAQIGIVFNSYNPQDGCEYVHLNPKARMLLTAKSKRPDAYAVGQPNAYRDRTVYQDTTPESVRDGLWIYQYGFDQKRSAFLDGAYYRPVILSELACAHNIFIARPINYRWLGAMPRSYIGIEDLKTEVAFNGAYAGERHQINLINALLDRGMLPADRYHPIALHDVEIDLQRGYLDYVFERLDVFDRARQQSIDSLTQYIISPVPA